MPRRLLCGVLLVLLGGGPLCGQPRRPRPVRVPVRPVTSEQFDAVERQRKETRAAWARDLAHWRRTLADGPTTGETDRAHLHLALGHRATGRFDEAAAAAAEVGPGPWELEARALRLECLLRDGRVGAALERATKDRAFAEETLRAAGAKDVLAWLRAFPKRTAANRIPATFTRAEETPVFGVDPLDPPVAAGRLLRTLAVTRYAAGDTAGCTALLKRGGPRLVRGQRPVDRDWQRLVDAARSVQLTNTPAIDAALGTENVDVVGLLRLAGLAARSGAIGLVEPLTSTANRHDPTKVQRSYATFLQARAAARTRTDPRRKPRTTPDERFLQAAKLAPEAPWAAEATFEAGRLLLAGETTKRKGLEVLSNLIEAHPNAPEAPRAAYQIAVALEVAEEYEPARRSFVRLLERWPDCDHADLAREHLAKVERRLR